MGIGHNDGAWGLGMADSLVFFLYIFGIKYFLHFLR